MANHLYHILHAPSDNFAVFSGRPGGFVNPVAHAAKEKALDALHENYTLTGTTTSQLTFPVYILLPGQIESMAFFFCALRDVSRTRIQNQRFILLSPEMENGTTHFFHSLVNMLKDMHHWKDADPKLLSVIRVVHTVDDMMSELETACMNQS